MSGFDTSPGAPPTSTADPSTGTTGSGACAGTAAAPVKGKPPCPGTCTITSETVATSPANRARTRIGVGEEVNLTVNPGFATWKITSGGGTIYPGAIGSHHLAGFTAGDRAGIVTITATGSDCSCTITFTIVEPSEVRMMQKPDSNLKHTVDRPDIGILAEVYLFPDDVCFYNVDWRELDVTAVTSGVYDGPPCKGAGHQPNPNPLTLSKTVEPGYGTKLNRGADHIYSGDTGTAPPFAPGSISFDIPNVFSVAGGAEKQFDTVRAVHTLEADGHTLTVSKAGANGTSQAGVKGTLQVGALSSDF